VLQWRAFREKGVNIAANIARVRECVAAACLRSGRRPEDVKLIAVTKTVSPELIRQAYEAGLRDFGENRVQEAATKRPTLVDLEVTWHLVGHLQSNKAKPARELFQYVHSVDSLRLAERLDRVAWPGAQRLPVLLEVNLGEELTKSGAREAELLELAEEVGRLPTLELRGLMAIPPLFEDADRTRPFFRRLRELADTMASQDPRGVSLRELSMGMSHDFDVAIEEGATMIRVGTAIFGPRP
jgi:pyridoxal phosphate enzyme (YggS family)